MKQPTKPNTIERRALFDAVWSKPISALAQELATSAYHLGVLCKRLNVPLPKAGHWNRKAAGKEVVTPGFEPHAEFDDRPHIIARPAARFQSNLPRPLEPRTVLACPRPSEHPKVAATRAELSKSRGQGSAISAGKGNFRISVQSGLADRAAGFLDLLVAAIEAQDWSLADGQRGLELAPDGEPIGCELVEKTDRVPHTARENEVRERAEYERKCALAERGIGYRPWPPSIPEHDYVPNGTLVFRLDQGLRVEGIRRVFSDGKRQRIEAMIPEILGSLAAWAEGNRAFRARQEEWRRQAEIEGQRRR